MAEQNWIDVTQEILSLPKSFKLLETVRDEKFNLQDGMHAHEINDNKIDPKFTISQQDCITFMLAKKQIKLPNELSIDEVLSIFIQTYKLESLVLKGYPLHNTIYTFTYLYDKDIYTKDKDKNLAGQAIYALVHSINCLGTYFYELHKDSSSIKEDDLNITMYSFSKQFDSHDQIVKELTNLQSMLSAQAKQNKQRAAAFTQLLTLIKLRKSIHLLIKSMGKLYDNKSQAKIQKDIQTVANNLTSVQQQFQLLKSPDFSTEGILKDSGIYSQRVYKTLRTHFGPRQLPKITLKEAINHIKVALDQFSLFIPVPTRLSILRDRIQRLHDIPLNIWSKSYIKNSMFHKEEYIFNTYKTEDLIWNDMGDYVPVKENWKADQKFIALLKPTAPVVSEVLFRYVGRNSRAFWEASKIYEDYNILIHLSNEFDASLFPPGKKELYLSSWYYNFGLNVMIKQLFTGIQIDLYQHYQYPYVFYLLQNLLGVYDRNSQVFLKKFDKMYQQSFFDDSLNKNKKKKTPELSRKYFTDAIFKRGLHYYVRSLHRILFVMVNRKLMQTPFEENLQLRIKNRFRIFKNVYYVRTIDYNQYVKDYEVICKDQGGYLTEAMELLKEAKNIFQKISQLEESDCHYKVKEDAENLMKICVKCSLAVMSLKMGQNTKTYNIENKNPKYPEISVC